MVVVDDGAEVSDATCVPFDRMYAVGGLEPKVDIMQTLASLEMCPLYMEFGAILLPYAHSHPPRLCNFVAQAYESILPPMLHLFVIEFFK